PLTGTVHQPPPVHQTFDAPGFVLCTFGPRLLDTHPEAIKVPYAHSNVQADEVLDRKSTRLNSSHVSISYAVFCLKKKNINKSSTKATMVSRATRRPRRCRPTRRYTSMAPTHPRRPLARTRGSVHSYRSSPLARRT